MKKNLSTHTSLIACKKTQNELETDLILVETHVSTQINLLQVSQVCPTWLFISASKMLLMKHGSIFLCMHN